MGAGGAEPRQRSADGVGASCWRRAGGEDEREVAAARVSGQQRGSPRRPWLTAELRSRRRPPTRTGGCWGSKVVGGVPSRLSKPARSSEGEGRWPGEPSWLGGRAASSTREARRTQRCRGGVKAGAAGGQRATVTVETRTTRRQASAAVDGRDRLRRGSGSDGDGAWVGNGGQRWGGR